MIPTTRQWLTGILNGLLVACIGLAPWLLSGRKLPLQNLWHSELPPEQMPWAALPLSQYYIIPIVAMLAVGGLLGGAMARQRSIWHPLPIGIGIVILQGAAVIQSMLQVRGGLGTDARAEAYELGLAAVVLTGILSAQLGLWLIGRGSVPLAALAVILAATLIGSWISSFSSWGATTSGFWTAAAPWIPPVAAGLALAWCGWSPPGRLGVWAAGLVALWVLPAVTTAIQTVAGSRALLRSPDLLPALGEYLVAALGPAGTGPRYLVIAVVIGVIGAWARRKRHRRRPQPLPPREAAARGSHDGDRAAP